MNGKETAVNVLIGTLLLAVFAIFFAAAGFALYGVDLAVKHFFPGLDRAGDIEFDGLTCLVALLWSVQQLRRRLWRNALLSCAIMATSAVAGGADLAGRGHNGFFFPAWPLFLLFVIPLERRMRRWELLLGAIFVSAGFAAATGMLGSTTIAVYVKTGVVLGVFAWFVVNARRGMFPGQSAPVASTRA
ncbi:MAG: hypothetical protein ACLQBK_20775 [Candidatus Sulfotelmatobacter sp.]